MALSGTQWYTVALSGTQWYSMVHSGTQWYSVIHSGTQWYTVILSGTQWYSVVLSGTKLCSTVPGLCANHNAMLYPGVCEAVIEGHACVEENHTTHCVAVLPAFVWPGVRKGGRERGREGRTEEGRE